MSPESSDSQRPRPKRILVAMSGGVDSSVAAALLKAEGHDVVGAFMRNGVKAVPERGHRQGCCGVDDARDARRVAEKLEIPFYALDFSDAFDGLIDDFVESYSKGETPNPCIECNRRFKLGALLKLAGTVGADAVATGHYAQVKMEGGRYAVHRGQDDDKDQSYVLFSLSQEQLAQTWLPLGHLAKAEVRAEARRLKLPVAEKAESMEICFVPTGDYRDVLRERAPQVFSKGEFVDSAGQVVGEHDGTAGFTIGQRRGLPGGQASPLYVTALEPETNTVIVGTREETLGTEFTANQATFSGFPGGEPGAEVRGVVKIRAHHKPVTAVAELLGEGKIKFKLETPVPGITPGQAAVLYDGDRVLLGGWIAREEGFRV